MTAFYQPVNGDTDARPFFRSKTVKFSPTVPLLAVLLAAIPAHAEPPTNSPAAAVGADQLKSSAWWRRQAVHYADKIADAEVRGKTHYELVYVLARAGDFDAARKATAPITNPQLSIYAHNFVAKECKKKGDDNACRAELQQAEKEALAWGNGFGHSAIIHTYLDFGQPAEALVFTANISNAIDRDCSFRDIAETLARQRKLDMAYEVAKQHVRPTSQEFCFSGMANACADTLQIDETLKLIERLSEKKLLDRAYQHLVEALLNADRDAEAAKFADRIADPVLQATIRGRIAAKSAKKAKKQSPEALQASIDKAATREEKLALYDLLFNCHAEAGNVEAAEAVIDSMIATIKSTPRKSQTAKMGTFDDPTAIALAESKYLATAAILAKRGDREGSAQRMNRGRKAITGLSNNTGILKAILSAVLVNGEIEAGDFKAARTTLDQLEQGYTKSFMAASVAEGLIKSGDIKSGLEVAELITAPLGKGRHIGSVAEALLAAGELKAAKTLLKKIGDAPDEVEAFRTLGQTLVELGQHATLRQWLDELNSDAARAYLCMGAAGALHSLQSDEAYIARVWIDRLRNERTDISEALALMAPQFSFDGRPLADAPAIRDEAIKLRKVLNNPTTKARNFELLNKDQMAKSMTSSKHSSKYASIRDKIHSMVLFKLTVASPTGGVKNTDGVYVGFDTNKKIVSWFD
jgi:pentatricopeptide repeat protein